jgi:hypothetical protein
MTPQARWYDSSRASSGRERETAVKPGRSYPAGRSTSPVSPEDIRAAAEVHEELGPEYSDAVVAVFLDKVDREIAARVEARLAETYRGRLARRGRRTLVTGLAVGACAGALIAGVAVAHFDANSASARSSGTAVHFPPPGFPPGPRTITLPDGQQVSIAHPPKDGRFRFPELPAAPGK